ncbi:MAG: LysR family transcriptional regulator [Rhizobiales bacterium]|nr:LysR family transcriptional regulator [Hyphomicrobiales bacterium]
MDWDKIKVFHAAAVAGSFTAAGAELELSQSAVSRQVSSLEEDLKVSLFHRHARGLLLTEQGERLLKTAHEVFIKLQAAEARLTDAKEKPSGDLRVTTTVGLGTSWLTPRIKEFIELYPDINLKLMLHDNQLDIGMRQADVAIWLRAPTQPDLIQRKMFTVHFHIYASPDYLKTYGQPRDVEELNDHKIIVFDHPDPNYLGEVNWLSSVGRSSDNPRSPVLSMNNIHGMRRAAEQGIGLAILPDYLISPESSLVRLMQDAEIPTFDTYLAYPEELRDSKRVNVFRDFLVSQSRNWKF